MKDIKTIALAVIAVGVFSFTIYQITADNGGDSTTAASGVIPLGTPTEATITEGDPIKPAKPALPPTSMTFREPVHDFGELNASEKSKHTFEFTNTGDKPLVITNARGSCGCTVPAWPKEPIAPGESGEIEVVYNSEGKKGAVTQTITIDANTNPPQTKLTIKVQVNPKEEEPAS